MVFPNVKGIASVEQDCLKQGTGLNDLLRSFPTLFFYDFYDS